MSYHQRVPAGLQGVEADAEEHRRGEGVVVDEAATVRVAMAPVQRQVRVRVAREEHRTEVDLQGDGLHTAVHADVSLRCRGWQRTVTVCTSLGEDFPPKQCHGNSC